MHGIIYYDYRIIFTPALRPHDLSSHEVIFVDWTHAGLAPLTTDVIHVLFTCCDTDIATNMTEALNSYYDYLKGYLAVYQLDRQGSLFCRRME